MNLALQNVLYSAIFISVWFTGFKVQKWQVQPQTTEQPGAIPEMLSFIQNTGIARILPLRNGRLITCLTDNQGPLPALSGYRHRISLQHFPECFRNSFWQSGSVSTSRWWLSDGIRHWSPAGSFITACSWYLIALQKGKLQVFPLADIKSVSLTSERFERKATSTVWSLKERFISALPHFHFIQ